MKKPNCVRVRTQDGEVVYTMDIRQPIRIEMEFEVLEQGHILVPNYHLFNEEEINIFVVSDKDPVWHRRPRPAGRYVSTVWIPGNLLSEGTVIVGAAVSTINPVAVHFYEQETVAFQVIDNLEGDSARGDYVGPIPGLVRPLLPWTTEFTPHAQQAVGPNF